LSLAKQSEVRRSQEEFFASQAIRWQQFSFCDSDRGADLPGLLVPGPLASRAESETPLTGRSETCPYKRTLSALPRFSVLLECAENGLLPPGIDVPVPGVNTSGKKVKKLCKLQEWAQADRAGEPPCPQTAI
jgi:hypothetical protein